MSRQQLSLGVLDLCKWTPRVPVRESLANTLDLAVYADSLGYSRFWIAEHHSDDAAQSSPEVLLPLLASRTKRIRVGAGGILLQYYSPMKVAETFLAIEALFPGRIDLGVCRGPGVTSSETARALVDGRDSDLAPEMFAKKAEALATFLHPAPAVVESGELHARPLGIAPPPLWVLGAGPTSARLAASLGASYGYSLFFGGGLTDGAGFVGDYQRLFTRRAVGPRALIAVSVLCADTASLAKRFDAELIEQGCYASNIVGTPKQCARMLKSFAALVGVEEILVASFVSGRRARREMYRQLADELFR